MEIDMNRIQELIRLGREIELDPEELQAYYANIEGENEGDFYLPKVTRDFYTPRVSKGFYSSSGMRGLTDPRNLRRMR